MKNIIFVSHERERNGATVSMISLIKELVKIYKWNILVIIPGHGEAENALREMGINYKIIHYFTNYRRIGEYDYFKEICKELVNFVAVKRIKKKLRKESYDYICSNSTAVDVGARASVKEKHIYYVREFMEEDFFIEYRNQQRMRELLENSSKCVFISKVVEAKYIKKYQLADSKVIYNGIRVKDYYIEKHTILNEQFIRIIQIGSVSEGKGALDSIKKIKEIKNRCPVQFTFLGKGEQDYIKRVNEYIELNDMSDCVTFLPYSRDIRNIIKNQDILLMNSKSEGFGRVTVEAMLGGLLVVGRNSGGTSEIINNRVNGLLYESDDEFVKSMISIDNNRDIYRKMALAGQEYAKQKFTPQRMAEDFANFICK